MSEPTSEAVATPGRRGGPGRGRQRRRGVVSSARPAPDPRLRRRGREPDRRRRARASGSGPSTTTAGATRTAPTSRKPASARSRPQPSTSAAGRRPDEPEAGLPEEFGATEVDGLALGRDGRLDHRAEGRPRAGASTPRRARPGRDLPGREHRLPDAARARRRSPTRAVSPPAYAATQAWAYASAFAGRGRRPDDRARHRPRARPGRARPGGRIGGEAADRALALRGARRPDEPPLPGGARRVRGGVVRGLHRRDAVRRRRPARALAVRRAARATRWPTPAFVARRRRPPRPTARPASPFDGEGSATRRTPLIEAGKLAGYLYDARTARKDGTRHHRQRGARLVPVAAVRGDDEPAGGAGRRQTLAELFAEAGDGPVRDRRRRPALRRQPRVRHLLRRAPAACSSRAARPARRCARSPSRATS